MAVVWGHRWSWTSQSQVGDGQAHRQANRGGGEAPLRVNGTGCSGSMHGEEGPTTASARKSGSLGRVMLNCSSKDEWAFGLE